MEEGDKSGGELVQDLGLNVTNYMEGGRKATFIRRRKRVVITVDFTQEGATQRKQTQNIYCVCSPACSDEAGRSRWHSPEEVYISRVANSRKEKKSLI